MRLLTRLVLAFAAAAITDARASPPNVILFSLDSVSCEFAQLCGYGVPNTPNLVAFARDGTVFLNAKSPAPWTVPSHRSLLTGTYPATHGLTNFWRSWADRVPATIQDVPGLVSFEMACRAAGHATGAFTGDAGVTPSIQDFDVHTEEPRFGLLNHSEGLALRWLDRVRGQPFCALFHGYNAHGQSKIEGVPDRSAEQAAFREANLRAIAGKGPYPQLTDAAAREWREWYDQKIASADADFGAFIAELKRRGLYDDSIISVTSDHGTDVYDHGVQLDQTRLHVVWALHLPGAPGGQRVAEQVSTIDVMPTVLHAAGIAAPDAQFEGRNVDAAAWGWPIAHALVRASTKFGNHVDAEVVVLPDGTIHGLWARPVTGLECLPVYPEEAAPGGCVN